MESIKPCIFGVNEFWSPRASRGFAKSTRPQELFPSPRQASAGSEGARYGQVAPRNRWGSHPKSGHRHSCFYNDWVSVDPMEWNHSGTFFEVNVWSLVSMMPSLSTLLSNFYPYEHQWIDHIYMGLSENVGYIPNEIAIFHRDNDQQNHWFFWGLANIFRHYWWIIWYYSGFSHQKWWFSISHCLQNSLITAPGPVQQSIPRVPFAWDPSWEHGGEMMGISWLIQLTIRYLGILKCGIARRISTYMYIYIYDYTYIYIIYII